MIADEPVETSQVRQVPRDEITQARSLAVG
jgi:hypothetical protein